MKKVLVVFVVSIGFFGCSTDVKNSNPEQGYYYNDFESLYYWNESGGVVSNRGKEGGNCIRVNSETEFSPTFKLKFSEVKVKSPKKVNVTAWFKVNDLNTSAQLVACIHHEGKNLYWKGVSTSDVARRAGTWTKIENFADVPENIAPDAQIVVYGWRTGTGEVLFDDFEIQINK